MCVCIFVYLVVNENSPVKSDIGHCQIKVNVSVGIQIFFYITRYKMSGPISPYSKFFNIVTG